MGLVSGDFGQRFYITVEKVIFIKPVVNTCQNDLVARSTQNFQVLDTIRSLDLLPRSTWSPQVDSPIQYIPQVKTLCVCIALEVYCFLWLAVWL